MKRYRVHLAEDAEQDLIDIYHKKELPAYEPDDGDLTARQIAAIRKRVLQGHMKLVRSSLF